MSKSFNSKYPWEDSITTEDLLLRLIKNSDETEKVDFKLDFNIQGPKQDKNELLRDLTCLANSYSFEYDNHGFLILGVDSETKTIIGSEISKESLTTHIDERMAKYVNPHIKFSVELFDIKEGKKWGAIITKPGIEMPHVFTNDSGEFNRGEVWVRKGSHNCPADASDFSRFYAIRTESFKRELDQLEAKMNLLENDLKQRISDLQDKSKYKPVYQKSPTKHSKEIPKEFVASHEIVPEDNKDLLSLVKTVLPRRSPLESLLIKEVKEGLEFLESDELPWDLHIGADNKNEALEAIQKIQSQFEKYYKAIFELSFFGDKNESADLIMNSIKLLARYFHRGGVPYDALYIRYLPLVTTLHIISVASVYNTKSDLLKKVLELELFNPDRYEKKFPITDSLFFIRTAQNLFNAMHPGYPQSKWCDGIGTYLKQYFSSLLSNYDEFQDPEAIFYKGEFLLSLTPLITKSGAGLFREHISAGSYLFYREARFILEEFVKNNKDFLTTIFPNLKEVLQNFDEYAPKIANSGRCWGDGFSGPATTILFPDEPS